MAHGGDVGVGFSSAPLRRAVAAGLGLLALASLAAGPPPAPPPLVPRPKLIGTVPGCSGSGWLAFSPDGRSFAVKHAARGDGAARESFQLWETATLRRRRHGLLPPAGFPLAFAPDGRGLAVCANNRVELYDFATGKAGVLCPSEGSPDGWLGPGGFAFSPDGRTLAITWDGHTAVWDFRSRKRRGAVPSQRDVFTPAFSADGATLAVGDGRDVRLYDTVSLRLKGSLRAHPRCIDVHFSPDGRHVTTFYEGDDDRAALLWDARTRRPLADLQGRESRLDRVSFSPDGRLLALGANLVEVKSRPRPGLVRFWDTARRQECGRMPVPWEMCDMAFSPSDTLLAVSVNDRKGRTMDVQVYRVLPPPSPGRVDPEPPFAADAKRELPAEAARWWADLAADDAEKAYAAILALAAKPDVAVAVLGRRLRPTTGTDLRRANALAVDLGSDSFTTRERASRELAALGERAEPALRRIEAGADAEARRRARRLLDSLEHPIRDAERLRAMRAAEVLELVASDDARRLLAWLASGAPEATLTREAAASLARLRRRADLVSKPK